MRWIPLLIAGAKIGHGTARDVAPFGTRPEVTAAIRARAEIARAEIARAEIARAGRADKPCGELVSGFSGLLRSPTLAMQPVSRRVQCLAGEVAVVIVDLRFDHPTCGQWQSIRLNEDDARTLHVPPGVACGWQFVSDDALLKHQVAREISTADWRQIEWNDPALGIRWPLIPTEFDVTSVYTVYQRQQDGKRSQEQEMPGARVVRPRRGGPADKSASRLQNKPQTDRRVSLAQLSRGRTPSDDSLPHKGAKKSATRRNRKAAPAIRKEPPKSPLILVIGSSGQLGHDLCRHLRSLGTMVGACRSPQKQSRLPVPVFIDVACPASLRLAIRTVKPNLIVNASGLTDVDQAEAEPRVAQMVNATAPAIMAEEARRVGACLIHFCTSMVYGGAGERPWKESDAPLPGNQYARTKLLGSQAIEASGVPHLILRTGWLYSTHGNNFVRRIVDLLTYRNTIPLANDYYGTPTSTDWLAATTAGVLGRARNHMQELFSDSGGLYHATLRGHTSMLEVGDQILATCRQHGLPVVLNRFQSQNLEQLRAAVRQAPNCRLDPSRLALRFGVELPRWQDELNHQLAVVLGAAALSERGVA